jgi:hypothetical protein
MLATERPDADAAEWKDPGLDRGLADDFDDSADVKARIEVGRILDGEMRHVGP